jgi:hypothetical protein
MTTETTAIASAPPNIRAAIEAVTAAGMVPTYTQWGGDWAMLGFDDAIPANVRRLLDSIFPQKINAVDRDMFGQPTGPRTFTWWDPAQLEKGQGLVTCVATGNDEYGVTYSRISWKFA